MDSKTALNRPNPIKFSNYLYSDTALFLYLGPHLSSLGSHFFDLLMYYFLYYYS